MQCNFAILNKNLTNIFSLRPTVRPDTLDPRNLILKPKRTAYFVPCLIFLVQQMFVNSISQKKKFHRRRVHEGEKELKSTPGDSVVRLKLLHCWVRFFATKCKIAPQWGSVCGGAQSSRGESARQGKPTTMALPWLYHVPPNNCGPTMALPWYSMVFEDPSQ